MTVITLPRIPGVTWLTGDGFSVTEHGELLHPSEGAEFLIELLACAPTAPPPELQFTVTLGAAGWRVRMTSPAGELLSAEFEEGIQQLLVRTASRPVL